MVINIEFKGPEEWDMVGIELSDFYLKWQVKKIILKYLQYRYDE